MLDSQDDAPVMVATSAAATVPDYADTADQLEAVGDAMLVLSTRLIRLADTLRKQNRSGNAPQSS